MGSALSKCVAVDLCVQWVGWMFASALKTEKFYDIAGSGTFILLAHLSRRWGGTSYLRQNVQTGLVTAWGLRLGMFLFRRILKDGQDSRFSNVRDSPGTFFVFWTLQAVWVFITLLPTIIVNTQCRDEPLCLRDYTGWGMWALGFAIEAIADQQKWNFKKDPDNVGRFIRHGLWAYSRHPNYLGEILQWSGLFLSASTVMQGPQYLSIVSPLFVWFLLRHISGIPILEKQAMARWGAEVEFQSYVRNTPLLWPFPGF
ncbi:uncharacterized protein si:ch211-210c8.6 [Electrophorus electricus]|uniref:Steroid 5-alpha reductase C-terminal domain-containing protein n=1 Tax=Electrophorus electricus TaxID=8005 RepID=A0A4W4HSW1_ELEEL|nr:uncharacterized protein si:ch211-210c8.6 [Electrophorus electricus]